jgi:hypothetical protein
LRCEGLTARFVNQNASPQPFAGGGAGADHRRHHGFFSGLKAAEAAPQGETRSGAPTRLFFTFIYFLLLCISL